MHRFLLDASAPAKRYAPEKGSDAVEHLFVNVGRNRLACILLGVGEVVAVLVRKRTKG